jgi:G3E family GTPase
MPSENTANNKTPVTLLTGFLGAGKTTLLNHILTSDHGKRYAVIVNEFGEIGIDNDLIVDTDEEIFEMNNGCICCTVRGDLIRILQTLMKRRHRFDAIVVETTGLADPIPVAQTFFMDQDAGEKAYLDAVVTVVDAKHGFEALHTHKEARQQVAFADIILVNKVDLVDNDSLSDLEARLSSINPYARRLRTMKAEIDLDAILDVGAFNLERMTELEPALLPENRKHQTKSCCNAVHGHTEECAHHHPDGHSHNHVHGLDSENHSEDIYSISVSAGEVDPEKVLPWLQTLVAEHGPDILRLKGILAFPDEPKRYVIQGIHMILEGDVQRDWQPDEKRESKLVFIGRELEALDLHTGFHACCVE